jgi:peptide/nickel transport system ATP-binding protein
MKAVPSLYEDLSERQAIPGSPPDLLHMPGGCPFEPRCDYARPECKTVKPLLVQTGANHEVSCHLYPDTQSLEEVKSS